MTMQQKIDSARQAEARGVIQLLAASGNANFADQIAAALLRAGYRLDPGEFDPNRIDAVVVLWTGVALDKPELVAVARAAWKAGRLAPVSIGQVEPPFAARDAAPMDLAGWRGDDEDPRWRFVLSDLESIKIRQRVSGLPVASAGTATDTPVATGDLSATGAFSVDRPIDDPVRLHHPARHLWRNHIRPAAAPFMAGMAVVSAAGLAAFSLGARNDQAALTAAPAQELSRTALRDGADFSTTSLAANDRVRPRPGVAPDSFTGPAIDEDIDDNADAVPTDASLAFVRPVDTKGLEQFGALAPEVVDEPLDQPVDQIATPDASMDDATLIGEIARSAPDTLSEATAAILAPRLKTEALTLAEATPLLVPPELNPQTEEVLAADLNLQALNDFGGNEAANVVATSAEISGAEPATTAYLGEYFSDCVQCPDMAALSGGAFTMGAAPGEAGRDPAESPQRRINIAYRFAIATRETTFDQWSACIDDGGCQSYAPADAGWGRGDRPVINVSYEDAAAYARWLSAKTGKYYRLPSEAEWEFAARAGTATPFAFGRSLSSDRANINGDEPYSAPSGLFRAQTVAVTAFQPNVYGLFDMHGNVWEWTSDCWSASHHGGPATGAARIDGDCSRRVIKGGAWNTSANAARSAHRQAASQMAQTSDTGFRVVRILD